MATLIIAEKPSVAKSIADVIGASTRRDGYFEGNNYFVSFAFGHLFSLYDAKDYDECYAVWNINNLPVIPEQFKYKIYDDTGVKKQFKIIKALSASADEIINACDSDREGSLIFAEIYQALGSNKPLKRLWVSSHTPEDLKEGFAGIRAGVLDAPLTAAGYARQWADWLLGINFTVAATKKFSGDGKMLPVGRVILPTVFLIYKKCQEIKNFIPEKYHNLIATFKAAEGTYTGLYIQSVDNEIKSRFNDPKIFDSVIAAVKRQSGLITSCANTRESKGPGKLFNQTDLQGHITSKFEGFTAEKVLKCAQSLYEAKHITYPRTASRYLNESQKDASKRVLEALKSSGQGFIPLNLSLSWHDKKNLFDNAKVESHPALMPTYLIPELSALSGDEKIVYIEIVKRFLAQFAPAAEYDKTEAITTVNTYNFRTRARVLVNPGWTLLYNNDQLKDEDKKEDEEESSLNFSLKEKLSVVNIDLKSKSGETKPPSKYTVKTLLAAMQNCGRDVEDESEMLKGYTIGTAATRAEILKKIEKIGYVQLKGKSYDITSLGTSLIELFPVREMLEPDFTGKLEKLLKNIETGTLQQHEFINTVIELTHYGIDQFRVTEGQIQREIKSMGKCPECGREVIETSKTYSCSGYRDKTNPCRFAIWKNDRWFESLGKKPTVTIVKGLLSGKTVLVKGMTSKAGKEFDAHIKLQKNEKGYWGFTFVNK
jgi:DNA topoisomerase-3